MYYYVNVASKMLHLSGLTKVRTERLHQQIQSRWVWMWLLVLVTSFTFMFVYCFTFQL